MTTQLTQHLAQLNIGRLRYEVDDPRMAEFVDNLARVNALADRAEGFVWRLQDASGNATSYRPYGDDPRMAINMSVWENVAALEVTSGRPCISAFMGAGTNGSRSWKGLTS